LRSATARLNRPRSHFLLGQLQGLQQALDLLGIQATTIQQVDELLTDNSSFRFAARWAGLSTGSPRWRRQPQFSYNFLYNDDHGLMGSSLSASHSFLYT
jgi:hypothetical protein